MSSSDRRFVLIGLAALAGLSACGYQPVYGTGGTAQALRGRIRVADPADRNGFTLLGRLEDRLGQPQAPRYDLTYRITTSEEELGITPAQETTRYNVLGRVDFTLTDRQGGQVVLTGSVNSFTGYSATGTTVSTRVAQRDAHERLMVILADQIVTRLMAAAGSLAP